MQYLTSQLICFSLITPVFPPVLHCYLIFFQSLLFILFFYFFVSTVLLPSTVPQVSLSSITFTFSQSYQLLSVRCAGAKKEGSDLDDVV